MIVSIAVTCWLEKTSIGRSLTADCIVRHSRVEQNLSPRCLHCLSEDHTAAVCPFNPNRPVFGWFHNPQHLMASAPSIQQTLPQVPTLGRGSARREICRNFNRDRCYLARCRFLHMCMECNGAHPSSHCPTKATPPGHPIPNRGRGPRSIPTIPPGVQLE